MLTSAIANSHELCLVCGKPTSTLHLQVTICYGCAAFYRRSINAQKVYKCKHNTGKCNLKSQKNLCRLCRFKQCQKLNLVINKNKECLPVLPSLELSPISDDSSDPWNVVDLFHQIHLTFKENTRIFNDDFDCHSYFTKAISKFYDSVKPKQELVPIKSDFIRVWFLKKFVINTAKLLSCSKKFQKLPLNEKIMIHDRFWQTFWYLVMFYQTIEYFGDDPVFKGLSDNYQYIDESTLPKVYNMDSSFYGTRIFAIPIQQKLNKFYADLKSLKATFNEFVYISLLTIWSFHGMPEISQSTQDFGDKIIQDASTKLHEYYTMELRMSNYAARQARLFRIARTVQSIVQSKNEMLKAWEFFNYGPHAFPWCKFETNYYSYKKV